MHRDFNPLLPGFLYTPANDCEALKALAAEHDDIAPSCSSSSRARAASCRWSGPLWTAWPSSRRKRTSSGLRRGADRQRPHGQPLALAAVRLHAGHHVHGKGLGGGLPIGACLFGEKTENTLTPGTHGSTFGGSPASAPAREYPRPHRRGAAGAGARQERVPLLRLRGQARHRAGLGPRLMIGLKTAKPAAEVVAKCMEQGVLVLTAHAR